MRSEARINALLKRAGCPAPIEKKIICAGSRRLGKEFLWLRKMVETYARRSEALAEALEKVLNERDALLMAITCKEEQNG